MSLLQGELGGALPSRPTKQWRSTNLSLYKLKWSHVTAECDMSVRISVVPNYSEVYQWQMARLIT